MAAIDFIVLDAETANSDFSGIFSIGMVPFRGGDRRPKNHSGSAGMVLHAPASRICSGSTFIAQEKIPYPPPPYSRMGIRRHILQAMN
jgi:hypothetical protein